MSKSRSPTPTPTRLINTSPSPEPSTSRLESNEDVPYPSLPRSPGQPLPHPIPIPTPPQRYPAESSRAALRRPAETPPLEEPSSKRRKRSTTMARQAEGSSTRSSPSTDSQDGLADTEHDTTVHDRSPEIPPAAPPKKKRTRTLTTPHQSAVLHALLAQSRFPTTAMREEVGRAIGLSARKVQIWFQNQRQKARRPRSQSDAPSNRTPHHEPYSTFPPPNPHYLPEGSSSSQGRTASGTHQPSEPAVQTGITLLGPGMPGQDIPSGHSIPPSLVEPQARAPTEHYWPLPHRSTMDNPYPGMPDSLRRPTTPGRSSSPSLAMRGRAVGESWPPGISRVLPPLTIAPPPPTLHPVPSTSSSRLPPLTHSAPPTAGSYELRRSSSPSLESLFAYRSTEHSGRSGQPIPPPFTLQPPPQWDPSTLAPRPSPSWSQPTSRSDNFPSYVPPRGPRPQSSGDETAPHLEPHSTPRRPGRYDPVRDNQS